MTVHGLPFRPKFVFGRTTIGGSSIRYCILMFYASEDTCAISYANSGANVIAASATFYDDGFSISAPGSNYDFTDSGRGFQWFAYGT